MATTNPPNFRCRMYELRYPEVGTAVMVQVKSISKVGAYVSLLEYENIEGMIPFNQLSRRSICVPGQEPAMVVRVDDLKGYIELSKRRVSEEDNDVCEDRYKKSKLVHSIMLHVSENVSVDLEDLYVHVGWPLHRKFGHAFEAFKMIVSDPDSILDPLTKEVKEVGSDGIEVTKVVPALTEGLKDALVKNIRSRMTPEPLKIRAFFEMKCFQRDGVPHIKEAMKKAKAAGNDDCLVKIKLVGPSLYVLTTQTLDKDKGIIVLNNAIKACTEAIDSNMGKLIVKEVPRVVTKVVPSLMEESKDALVKNIRRRMTPQPLKIRAVIEMKCFQLDGVLHIKEAMKKAEAAGNYDCLVKIKLVAPSLYVLTTQTLDKDKGIIVLNKAIKACTEAIESNKGKLIVKEAPKVVSKRKDKLPAEPMARLEIVNEEVDGDLDSEEGEEEDIGMGEVDIENPGIAE